MRSRPDERTWLYDGTLHVGAQTVELGEGVDQLVLGATGVYWMRGQTLMFTSAEGGTQEVEDVGWGDLAVSADRSVFATVDQSRGPTDEYGPGPPAGGVRHPHGGAALPHSR
ncbi:MAG: hypothetical protein ACXWXO_15120 [Nocardioides sp.]